MQNSKTSLLSNSLLWLGAAISIAEIMTGALFAPLGFTKGMMAIILGHAIGALLFYWAGLIGAKSGMTAMESVRISFGEKGSMFFSVLNVLQLVGWTAVMIISEAQAIAVIAGKTTGSLFFWCLVIGIMIAIGIVIGLKNLGKVNVIAVSLLFILTVVLAVVIFRSDSGTTAAIVGTMSFGAAVELSVAMPLSWLPLVADYTKEAEKPVAATLVSSITYFLGSCWMYIIGLAAALFAGTSDVAQVMVTAGLGLAGTLIILLATVSTTFLDVYSAGVSLNNISSKINIKWAAIIVCIIGTLIAMFTPVEQYENFLYAIGSVFAPMVAILITDFFILKENHATKSLNITNVILWIVGFIIYRRFMTIDTIIGSTVPVMIIISLLAVLVKKVIRK